jgi:hypothetical protein
MASTKFVADHIWLIATSLVFENMIPAKVKAQLVDIVDGGRVGVPLTGALESDQAREFFTKVTDTPNIQTHSLRQILAVKIVAFGIEKMFDPRVKMLLEYIDQAEANVQLNLTD